MQQRTEFSHCKSAIGLLPDLFRILRVECQSLGAHFIGLPLIIACQINADPLIQQFAIFRKFPLIVTQVFESGLSFSGCPLMPREAQTQTAEPARYPRITRSIPGISRPPCAAARTPYAIALILSVSPRVQRNRQRWQTNGNINPPPRQVVQVPG